MQLQRTEDSSYTLYSDRYRQTYHSVFGAATESRHVFIDGAGVRDLLTAGRITRILEVGFGAGLNFFLTADLALSLKTPLDYYAFENHLLDASLLARLKYDSLLDHPWLVERVIAWRDALPDPLPNGLLACPLSDTLSLSLMHADAAAVDIDAGPFDAVYLDAFSPDENPELWTESFFHRLGGAMQPGARLSTYSARGLVRRNLAAAGFDVIKAAGPPGKRDMVIAVRRHTMV